MTKYVDGYPVVTQLVNEESSPRLSVKLDEDKNLLIPMVIKSGRNNFVYYMKIDRKIILEMIK